MGGLTTYHHGEHGATRRGVRKEAKGGRKVIRDDAACGYDARASVHAIQGHLVGVVEVDVLDQGAGTAVGIMRDCSSPAGVQA